MDLVRVDAPPAVPISVANGHPAADGHAVHFYDRDYGAREVAAFLAEAIEAGGTALVIATPEHRRAIVEALASTSAADPQAAIDVGRLVLLDAADTLAAICGGGEPTYEGLRREVGPLLAPNGSLGARVRAYGEIVDLLAQASRFDAAVALESAWNRLLLEHPVELLCGYQLSAFDREGDSQAFRHTCAAHARVRVAGEDQAASELPPDRLVAELHRKARLARLAAERLALLESLTAANRAREEAERMSQAKDEFLSMLGHELRNPLAPIVNALQLMKLRGSGELERERALIDRQVSHLLRLVEDLLDVSRITRGKIQLEQRSVELAEVVAQALETVGPTIAQRTHRLVVDVATEGLRVDGDPTRLAQVFANLLGNAAKYTPSDGRLELRAESEDGWLTVSIRDNGMGISPELLPAIFDPFVQGPRARDRSEGGLGLGLAIVHSLVRLHGGSVKATSGGIGKGSEFVVSLPLSRGAPREHPYEEWVGGGAYGSGMRVLVVDDNVDAAETLAELLSAMGCDARVAHDGPAALILAKDLRPRLVLLDIGLPVMDGYEVAARLRAGGLGREHLVALTGYGQPEDRERSSRAGFDEHFVKPLAHETLARLVRSVAASDGASPAPA